MDGKNRQELLKEIGEENWNKWCDFIMGSTVGINSTGQTVYYTTDIKIFKSRMYKEKNKDNK